MSPLQERLSDKERSELEQESSDQQGNVADAIRSDESLRQDALEATSELELLELQAEARQAEKKSTADSSSEQKAGQSFDMSAPVSRKEAKKRSNATSPEKSVRPSARGQGGFLDEHHNCESASEQA